MLFDFLKKQTAESAAALVVKAEENLARLKIDKDVAQQKLQDSATAHWVSTIESGETAPWTPPDNLRKQLDLAAHKVTAAEGVLAAARQHHENVLQAEAEKREAEHQAKIKAIKADVLKRGKAVDVAIVNLADAISALRKAQAAAMGECPDELITEFARSNLALMPVLSRKIIQKAGDIPGLTDNRILKDSALETFAQHLPVAVQR